MSSKSDFIKIYEKLRADQSKCEQVLRQYLKAKQLLLPEELRKTCASFDQITKRCAEQKRSLEESTRLARCMIDQLQRACKSAISEAPPATQDAPPPQQISDKKLNEIRAQITSIEFLLADVKRERVSSYQKLLDKEVVLWEECVFLEKKISDWIAAAEESANQERTGNTQKISIVRSARNDTAFNDETNQGKSPAVAALEKFIAKSGGKWGGWSEEDHQIFLRIRTKYAQRLRNHPDAASAAAAASIASPPSPHPPLLLQKEQPENEAADAELKPANNTAHTHSKSGGAAAMNVFLTELERFLAPIKRDKLLAHETWHLQMCALTENKRREIAQWRARKRQQEERAREQTDADDGATRLVDGGDDNDNRDDKTAAAVSARRREEMEAKRAQLDAWREEKRREAEERRQERVEAEAVARRQESEQSAARRLETRLRIDEYRAEKQAARELTAQQQLAERTELELHAMQQRRAAESRVSARNQRLEQQREEQRIQKERALQRERARLERVGAAANMHEAGGDDNNNNNKDDANRIVWAVRDPSRLLQGTQAQQQRELERVESARESARSNQSHQQQGGGGGCRATLSASNSIRHVTHKAMPSWRK